MASSPTQCLRLSSPWHALTRLSRTHSQPLRHRARPLTKAHTSVTIPEFLAPRLHHTAPVRRNLEHGSSAPTRRAVSSPRHRHQSTSTSSSATTTFPPSSTTSRQPPPPAAATNSSLSTTKVLANPRLDDDGVEMNIGITPRAANRLRDIITADAASANLALRITVSSGGCHGFQYLMSLEHLPHDTTTNSSTSAQSSQDPTTKGEDEDDDEENDTIFMSSTTPDARIVLNAPSLRLLRGSAVDYTEELIGSQFKIVGNPRAKSSCGCGTSFDVEF